MFRGFGFTIFIVVWSMNVPLISGQVLGFDDYNWQQKDSVITTLFYGGALNVCDVLIEEAYQAEKAKASVDEQALAVFTSWQGVRYMARQSLDTAEQFLSEALAIYETKPELQDSAYRDVLLNLADVKIANGSLNEGITLFRNAENLMEKNGIRNKDLLLNTLTAIISATLQSNEIDLAEQYGRKALGFAQKNYGEKTDEYISALTNLGKIYQTKGQSRRAANVILQAYELSKINLPSDHGNRLLYANNAAEIYTSMGRITAVGEVYDEMIAFFEDNPSQQESTVYPTILEKKASWYESKGNLEKAYEFYNRANILLSLRAERTSPEYIQSEMNMANILRRQKKYLEAEGYYQSALQYAPQLYGADSWSMAILQENLGDMYTEMNEHQKALEHRQAALALFEVHMQDQDPTYALALQKLGETHHSLALDSLADQNLKEAHQILAEIYGQDHPLLYGSNLRLAKHFWARDMSMVADHLQSASQYAEKALLDHMPLLSNVERQVVYDELGELLNLMGSLAMENNIDILDDLFDLSSTLKASRAQSNLVSVATLRANPSLEFRKDYNQWQELRKQIIENQNLPIARRIKDQAQKEQAKNLLSKMVSGYQSFDPNVPNAFEVRNKLSAGELAIDFLAINPYQPEQEGFAEKQVYLAVLNPGQARTAKLITLDLNQNALATSQAKNQAAYYQQLWAPLEPQLEGISKIYLSPDQDLHRISFSSLPTKDGGFVFDDYLTVRINSAADIFQQRTVRPQKNGLVFAFPDYSLASSDLLEEGSSDFLIPNHLIAAPTVRSAISFAANSASLTEANALSNLLEKKKWKITKHTGQDATVSNLRKELKETSGILHLSTKAFFVDIDSNTTPLLNAGIALTGARPGWNSDTVSGIMTALELSTLNLQGIDLFVVGENEVKSGVGFASLHNALSFAGVKNTLVSLWDVPAEGRKVFFNLFYKNLAKNQAVRDALFNAKKKMRKKFDPINWAGFVLLES